MDNGIPFSRVCFVIPTYNEAGNIALLLERLAACYPGSSFRFLVVDDNSPDGTAALVRECASCDARVHLLEGPRQGLGRAYVRGMSHALEALEADAVVQMDADFSHDPADAGRLLSRLADEADAVIGSRYVPGGSIDPCWGLKRRQLSLWGNRLARWMLGLQGLRDCTAGFRAIGARALRAAAPERIRVEGYVFQIALLHRLAETGARIVEEPVHFRDRERGETKLGLRQMAEFLGFLLLTRLGGPRRLFRYGVTGCIGVSVNLGSFSALLALGLHEMLASPIAIELSILSNLLINSVWTFRDRTGGGPSRRQGLKYHLVALASLALGYGSFAALSLLQPNASPVLLQGCAILPAALFNYLLSLHWTFRYPASGPAGGS